MRLPSPATGVTDDDRDIVSQRRPNFRGADGNGVARIDSPDSGGESAAPLIDTGDRRVTPATASSNRAAAPVTLRDALAAWSDGSLAAHTQAVREQAKGYAGVRLTCADHPPGRKTCSHCRDAKKVLDWAKSRGPGHCYAGHFAFRHRYGLVALSRVVPLDFDGLDDPAGVRDSLASLPYCIGSRVSVSGRGGARPGLGGLSAGMGWTPASRRLLGSQ